MHSLRQKKCLTLRRHRLPLRLERLEDRLAPATIQWDGDAGNNLWTDAKNWAGDKLPGSADDAVVGAAFSGQTIQVPSGVVSIRSMTTSSAIELAGGSLSLGSATSTINDSFLNSGGTLNLSSTTLNGPGTLTNAAGKTLNITSSTINAPLANQGLVFATGVCGFTGSFTAAAGSTLRVATAPSLVTSLTIASGFTNLGSIELTATVAGNPCGLTINTGTLVNAPGGMISSLVGAGGGSRTLDAKLDNQGTFDVEHPLFWTVRGASTNSGAVNVGGGDLTLSQGSGVSFSTTGSVSIASGRTLTISGGKFNYNAGTLTGSGTLALSNTAAAFALLPTTGALTLSSSTANLPSDLSTSQTTMSLTSSTLNGPGTLTNAAGKTLNVTTSTVNAPLVNQGLVVASGVDSFTGALTTAVGSTLQVAAAPSLNGFLTVASGFTNLGTIELTSIQYPNATQLTVTSGTLVNAPGATITNFVGAGGVSRNLDGQLDNQGTLDVQFPLAWTVRGASTSSGAITVAGGNLSLGLASGVSFSNTGTVTVGSGRTLMMTGGTFNMKSGTLSGTGSFSLSSTSVNLTSDFSTTLPVVNITSATVNGPGTLTNAAGKTLNITDGKVYTPLINQGVLVASGFSTFSGTYSNTSGATLRVAAAPSLTGFLTVASGFTNHGTIEITSIQYPNATSLTITAGKLVNASDGILVCTPGAGGSRSLNAVLDNQGTFDVQYPLSISLALNNIGTLTVSSGDLSINVVSGTPVANAGTVVVGAGRTLALVGAAFTQTGAVTGPGTLSMDNTTANFTTDFTNAMTSYGINNSTINGSGTFSIAANKTQIITTSNINVPVTNQGTLVASGVCNISNSYSNTPNATLRVAAAPSLNGFLTVASGFTNHGTIEFTSIQYPNATALTITAGVLINASDGTLVCTPGAGGSRSLNAVLDNQGNVDIQYPLAVSKSVTSSGKLNIARSMSIQQGLTLANGPVTVLAGQTLAISGPLTGGSSSAADFDILGTISLVGPGTAVSPQLLEVMSQDLGSGQSGYFNNFSHGAFSLSGTYVKLVDSFDNAFGAGKEALYADSIIVPSGSTLDLNGIKAFARSSQIQGSVVGGVINPTPDGGAIALGTATSGRIDVPGQVDDWTFFARANDGVTVFLNPGDVGSPPPTSPTLGWAKVSIIAPDNTTVLATTECTAIGQTINLRGINLPFDGTYHIRVQAAASHSTAIGFYQISAFESRVDTSDLVFNQRSIGLIETPYSVDRWEFIAGTNRQVRLDVVALSSPGLVFKFSGPNNWVGFVDRSTDTGLITLPSTGAYQLEAYAVGQSQGSYSFRLDAVAESTLSLGVPLNGTLNGGGDGQIFKVEITQQNPLKFAFDDTTNTDHTEMYLKLGSPPSRQEFDYRFTKQGADHVVIAPLAAPGTWYALVYGEAVPAPSNFTMTASSAPVVLDYITPDHYAKNAAPTITITGAGFVPGTQAKLVSGSTTISASTISVDSFSHLSAKFVLNNAGTGKYDVTVTLPSGETESIVNGFEILPIGIGQLKTNIITPPLLGRTATATIYVEYSNIGTQALEAPILTLKTVSPDPAYDRPILTLDPRKLASARWSNTLPDGVGNEAVIYATGATTGLLMPGESVKVPVYFGGLQEPWSAPGITFQLLARTQFDYSFAFGQSNPNNAIDWPSFMNSGRPEWIDADAWMTVIDNLSSGVSAGQDWAHYVRMASDNAFYLARLGQNVTDVNELFGFELLQANGLSPLSTLESTVDAQMPSPGLPLSFGRSFGNTIIDRFRVGPFGRGWSADWQIHLQESTPGGTVTIYNGTSIRRFQPDSRHAGAYFSPIGDSGKLQHLGNGSFVLTESNGTVFQFTPTGLLDFVEDINTNRIMAGYTGNQLTSLTHSSGASLTITYNAAGLIASIADSAGRVTTYGYDPTNTLLAAVTNSEGTTVYGYNTDSLGSARRFALLSIQRPGGVTQSYSYDSRGKLVTSAINGTIQAVHFTYGTAGDITATDASGVATKFFFDQHGWIARQEDGLGNYVNYERDDAGRIIKQTNSLGYVQTSTWCDCGQLKSSTDELGHTVNFTLGGPLNHPLAFIDARGNTTSYGYDARGNLLNTTYSDGSVERTGYNAFGNVNQITNRRGQVIQITNNAAGQITQEKFPDNSTNDYSYDARGRLTQIVTPQGTTVYTYDTADRLTKIDYPAGRWLQYTYDAGSRRTQLTDHTGFIVKYGYDAAGRLITLKDASDALIDTYTYDAAGRLSREDHGNGSFSIYAYDSAGWPITIVHYAPGGTVNESLSYTYDALGRPTHKTTLQGIWTYAYDMTGQLTHASFTSANPSTTPDQDLTYEYDAAGNRRQTVENGIVTNYLVDSLNRYTNVGNSTFAYDLDGNMIGRDTGSTKTHFDYDALSRLTKVTGPTFTKAYEYDGSGRQAASVLNGQRTEYMYDIGHGIAEFSRFDSLGNKVLTNVFGDGIVASQTPDSQWKYYDQDAAGSVVGVTSVTGVYDTPILFDPYGRQLNSAGQNVNGFGYLGGYGVEDTGTQLLKMGVRYYDFQLGRFTSEDPIGLGGRDSNLYRYAFNAPTFRVDPAGMFSVDFKSIFGKIHAVGFACNKGFEALWKLTVEANVKDKCGRNYTIAVTTYEVVTSVMCGSVEGAPFGPEGVIIAIGKNILDKIIENAQDNEPKNCKDNKPNNPGPTPGGTPDDEQGVGLGLSNDPNEKFGAAGFGAPHFVTVSSAIPYRINFENLGPGSIPTPTQPATAPAQRVEVTDQLSTNLDWSTLQFSEFGFGDFVVTVPADWQYYFTTVPMTLNGHYFNVEVEMSFDSATGQIRIVFQSLDPNSQLPPDVLTGFLPPEDGNGGGKGHVSYSVKPKANLITGTEIRNIALIRFDGQTSIATNQIDPHDPAAGTDPNKEALNTIDAGLPTGSVAPLPPTITVGQFQVNWSGADIPGESGIGSFDVFVSDNSGPFTQWLVNTPNTSGVYVGENGHTYGFYVVAIDNAGNHAVTPSMAQATTTLDIHPPTIQQVIVNDGVTQRSIVKSLTVTFNTVIQLPMTPENAFVLAGPSGAITTKVDSSASTPLQTIARLTFSGAGTEFGSLADGKYSLTILSAQVQDNYGFALDGDNIGTAGGDYVLNGTPASAPKLFRLFGDSTGDGVVNSDDFSAFRSVFGLSGPSFFDANNDNQTNASDFAEFRKRFGLMV